MKSKLVRDKIPAIIAKSGKMPDFYVAHRKEYEEQLLQKVSEELEEFRENPCLEEAADLYEVWLSICNHWNLTPIEVVQYAAEKRNERGGFKQRFILKLRNYDADDNEDEPTEDWDCTPFGELP